MKKFIVFIFTAIILAVGTSFTAKAQLNIAKQSDMPKQVKTIALYWTWVYQDKEGYYLVTKSDNQFDDDWFWLPIGSTKEECIESIDGLLSITESDDDSIFTIDDARGGKLNAFKFKYLGETMVCLTDVGHRYAGKGTLAKMYLNKTKRWCEENIK